MQIDRKKLARQERSFNLWREAKAVGAILAVTGFGKTFILIMALRYMNKHYPDRTAIILVPNTNLLDDWMRKRPLKNETGEVIKDVGHLLKWKIENTQVFVINTFITYENWKCDFFGIDEVHRILNEDAQQFSKALAITNYRFIMAMTATLSDKQREFLLRFGIKVVDTITEEEAQKEGFIAPAVTYNLGITLSQQDKVFNDKINQDFNYYFAKFNHEFDLVKVCNASKGMKLGVRLRNGSYLGKKTKEEWVKHIALNNRYDGNPAHPYSPENIVKYAAQAMRIIRVRKTRWQNAPSKIPIAVELIKQRNVKTLVFCESSAMADSLTEKLGKSAVSYHTNLTTIAVKEGEPSIPIDKDVLDKVQLKRDLKAKGYTILSKPKRLEAAKAAFNDPNSDIKVMVTVRAVDEGADFKSVELVLFMAYNSTGRQRIQREGRGRRIEYDKLDKKTLIVFLYMIGTQEEKWLKNSQKGKRTVRWITSINQINLNQTIKLGSNDTKEVEISEIEVISSNKGG